MANNLHKLTVMEATNKLASRAIIRVSPTLATSAYTADDVLFTGLEIPNAVLENGGSSMLVGAFLLDQSDQANIDIDFYFTEESTAFGSQQATANIAKDDMKAIGLCGAVKCVGSHATSGGTIDNVRVHQLLCYDGASVNNMPLTLLQAKSGSTSVYCHAIADNVTPDYDAADDLQLILHIEY
jgi:hypothetical protein